MVRKHNVNLSLLPSFCRLLFSLESFLKVQILDLSATESQRFTIRQLPIEFHRINNINLRNQFYKELDRHTPKLITLFRDKATKTVKTVEELAKLMRIYDLQEQRDINMRWDLILGALPVYLHEDSLSSSGPVIQELVQTSPILQWLS
ncbi:hypothetical protein F2P79_006756 [Pimephales promelas]|nr:hypothetical protein F2P79_006756 [Pimephales promelas]